MGIIDAVKGAAGSVARGIFKIASGKSQLPANESPPVYRRVEQVDDETTKESVAIGAPPRRDLKGRLKEFEKKAVQKTHDIIGSNTIGFNPTGAIKQTASSSKRLIGAAQTTTETAQAFISKIQNPRQTIKQYEEKQKRAKILKMNVDGKSVLTAARQSEKAHATSFISHAKKAIVSSTAPIIAKAKTTSIRQDMAFVGNAFIKANTGKDPAKAQQRKNKRIDMGRKISKKEAKELQKKYGKNWRMAVSQKSNGDYFSVPDARTRQLIKRENLLDSHSVDFGNAFPEPSMSIGSSQQAFVARNTDPTDIDANFMGDRGSGFTVKRDPLKFMDNSNSGGINPFNLLGDNLTKKKTKTSDPFSINGFKL